MRKMPFGMWMLTVVLLGWLGLAVASCGGTDPTPVPSPSPTAAAAPTTTPPPPAPPAVNRATVSAPIGAEGGTLDHPTGAKLVVPPGALGATTTISITGRDAPASSFLGGPSLGQGFSMGPDGLAFLKPVSVTLPFDATKLPAGATTEQAQVLTAPAGSTKFVALETTADLAAGRLTAQAMHFSEFVAAQNLNPVFVKTKSPLAAATVGAAYSAQLEAVGGTAPYRWSIALGGAGLPPGLTLAQSGALGGTPTKAGVFDFNVLVEDAGTSRVQRAFSITVNPGANPVPKITALDPRSIAQGAADTLVTITGTGLVPASVATWNGANLATTYVSATQIKALVPSANLATAGQTPMTVKNPTPGGGTSNTINFTVLAVTPNPAPTVTSINPTSALAGSPDTQITVTGTGFIAQSKAVIGAQELSTLYVSATELEAVIPAAFLTTAGSVDVAVKNPAPGGGTSAGAVFTIGSPNPVPTLTSMTPTQATAGGSAFTLTLTGTGFVTGGQAFFGATALATTVASATSATATVPQSLIATVGTASVTLVNPTPGGGASNALTFTIAGGAAPTINSLSPAQARSGSGALPINVWSNSPLFTGDSIAYANGTALGTIFVSAYSLYATIPASMLATTGSLSITVKTAGGPDSNALTFDVVAGGNAIPTVTSVATSVVPLGSSATTVTITGTNFINAAQTANRTAVYWRFGGEASGAHLGIYSGLAPTVASSTSLTVQLPTSVLATAGDHWLKVVNPGTGGGASGELVFAVNGSNPVPDITSIAPAGPFGTGTADVALTLTAASPRFVSRTTVTASGAAIPTTFLGRCAGYGDTCKITLPASVMTQAGTLTITATSPVPGGGAGTTAAITIVAGHPTPQVTARFPSSLTKNAPGQRLSINGSGFIAETTVKEVASNTSIPIASRTASNLQLDVPASLLDGTYATLQLAIANPGPAGGSATIDVPVVAAPLITSVTPNPLTSATAFTMTITGANLDLVGTAAVNWDGANFGTMAPTTQTATQWTIDFPATAFPNAGGQNLWITIDGHPTSNFVEVMSQ